MNKDFFQKDKEKTTDTWLTPPNIINSLGEFDLDPCCPSNMPWTTAKTTYSLERGEDGLKLPWFGRVWLNPPYSNWVPFIKKLKEHNNGIAILFVRTETRGFFDNIWDDADSMLFLKGRLKFLSLDGDVKNSATAASVLIAYGKNNSDYLETSGLNGKFVRLK